MKVFKRVVIVIVAIVAVFYLVALFLPSAFHLERSIVINKSPEAVFGQVSDFNNWMKWNPWSKLDPNAKNTISGEPGDIGSSWEWEGEEVGRGILTIAEIEPNESIHSNLQFLVPWESSATDDWKFEATASGTKVTWISAGELPYPLGRYMGLMMDSELGAQMEQGLGDLKSVCETLPDEGTNGTN